MIRASSALCALLGFVFVGSADAHDSGPEIARALVALRQSPISVDPSVPLSEKETTAMRRRLERSSGISVAILPVDFSLSAVRAAREIEFHLARAGTVVVVLGGDLGAISTDVEGRQLGALVRDRQAVYNRSGPVPALIGLIDRIEVAKARETEDGKGGWMIGVASLAAIGLASVLTLIALRRARRL